MQKQYRTSREVRARYGDASEMSLWRWLRDPKLDFPKPLIIQRRRFWTDEQLDEFDARQREVA
ncbi:DNA-binding protein [Mesorhizobium sp. C277A]|uniref:hypothetical protein n=1 Tax=unclassified Mesorhizobium TaxID=325217 RepID=UPI0003CF6F39|nr:hypothetical protein [Mesorhizobium sp. LSJC277A00]ESW69072.1 hypothetical protein X771_08405 [Mesorhizobium sp. LSJC277A00]